MDFKFYPTSTKGKEFLKKKNIPKKRERKNSFKKEKNSWQQ